MKTFFNTFFLFLLVTGFIYAQQKTASISFDTKQHNFGKFKEEKGKITHKFIYTNTGGEPLIIHKVKASCGCTSPNWTKEPVPPGGKGFVSATYDPRNRPGPFNKSITVNSNAETPVTVLRISGDVIPRVKTIEDIYPQHMAGLRLKKNHISLGKTKNTDVKTDSAEVINNSEEPITIGFERVPGHIKISAIPPTLKPKEKGIIVATYDAKQKNDWGFSMDRITVKINESNDPRNRLSVSATLEEDFASWTEEQLANAPVAEFDNTIYNFGTIAQGKVAEHEFVLTNKGKTDLMIRKLKPS